MKKSIVLIVVFGVLLGGTLVYYFAFAPKPAPIETVAETVPLQTKRNDLPNLSMVQVDQANISLKNLEGKVVLIFFNPDCDHCQMEAEEISSRKSAFDGYQVYFATPDSMKTVKEFAVKYKLLEPNFHLGHSEMIDIYNSVGLLQVVPTIFIYKDQQLIKRFDGVTTVDKIKEFL